VGDLKATPGPWSIITDDDSDLDITVNGGDADNGQIASQWVVVESPTHAGFAAAVIDMNWPNSCDDDKLNANAHLIAAAPKLYEALYLVVKRCGPNSTDGAIARAAIAKARGEAPPQSMKGKDHG